MKYFDLHCDTATELFDRGENLSDSTLHISDDTISSFKTYSQVFAIFSKHSLSNDECFDRFFKVTDFFELSNGIKFCKSAADINDSRCNFILSVEDARLIGDDLSRIDSLYERGVRIFTPFWSGVTTLGGSFDTDEGLSRFGIKAAKHCLELGITLDIPHASFKSAREILSIASEYGAPVIASHSNSYEICPHPRNLPDDIISGISSCGGIIGVCLHSPHLSTEHSGISDVARHVIKLVGSAGPDAVCLGCDLDGTDMLPDGISSQKDLFKIAEALLSYGFDDEQTEKVFYRNAFDFFKKNLGIKRKAIQ